eukprot:m.94849 g.94849  ORF g.94849 m.94849 type:complete len:655 (+) comp10076_c0_seq3:79-2043(+)
MEAAVEDALSCPICTIPYTDDRVPRALACLHTFCEPCLVKMAGGRRTISCPNRCTPATAVPDGDVCKILCNFALLDASLAVTARAAAAATVAAATTTTAAAAGGDAAVTASAAGPGRLADGVQSQCEACEERTTTHRCVECAFFICDVCTRSHRRMPLLRDHTVQTLAEFAAGDSMPRTAVRTYCLVHPSPSPLHELTLVCKTCDLAPICRDCIVIDHRDHDYTFLADVATQQRAEITELVGAMERRGQAVEGALLRAEPVHRRVDQSADEAAAKISAMFDTVRAAVDAREETVRAALHGIVAQKHKALDAQHDTASVLHASIDSCVAFVRRAVEHGTDAELLLSKPAMVRRLDELAALECPPCDVGTELWVADNPEAVAAIDRVGAVSTIDATAFAVSGVGVEGPVAALGGEVTLTIVGTANHGDRVPIDLPFVVVVRLPWDDAAVPVPVESIGRGRFVGRYTPQPPAQAHGGGNGQGTCEVTLFGAHVPGSPFTFDVVVAGVVPWRNVRLERVQDMAHGKVHNVYGTRATLESTRPIFERDPDTGWTLSSLGDRQGVYFSPCSGEGVVSFTFVVSYRLDVVELGISRNNGYLAIDVVTTGGQTVTVWGPERVPKHGNGWHRFQLNAQHVATRLLLRITQNVIAVHGARFHYC